MTDTHADQATTDQSSGQPATDLHVEDIAEETLDVPEPDAAPVQPTFAEMGARAETVAALEKIGIVRTFPIQQMTLQIAMSGHDLIGQARTGTGKTLGFGVPLLEQVRSEDEGADGTPQALVVVPTRELCVQVARDIKQAGSERRIRVEAIYGGRAYEPQVAALEKGVDVIVGTPGRLIDLAEQAKLVLGKVKILVLDEADEMLDLGFLPDIEKILRMVPDQRQTMLFSATMPGPIVTLARQFMTQPTHIRAESHDDTQTAPTIRQIVYRAHALDKPELLARVLQTPGRELTLIFTRTKRTAQNVADELESRGFAAAAVHGDLGQGAREQALRAFRSGKVDVLVATDVAARGLDITGVSHVINYQTPEDEKTYVHRIGRTGRAGKEGIAITLVDWDDLPRWTLIDKLLDLGIPEPAETYSTSTHLYEELGIPESATGRLPRSQRTREGLDAEQIEDLGERRRPGRSGRDRDETGERPRKPRSGAPRRRTRGANRSTPAQDGAAGTAPSAADRQAAQDSQDSRSGSDGERQSQPRKRRRRSRGRRGSGGGQSGAGDSSATQSGTAPTEQAPSADS
ncbi:DEAD/DEAH box helicase [Blastococcus sp. Marseille-P5729]|uniref:DEAD/DEAH box helicase n=1 Tax=Blastococcus sp. Marseille-P5729 TaxID=2086582 RepID=UPI001F3D5C92|nr:DEAD/DEAH box helicase [Blastococcus sp. Marseille-P5729]